MEVYVVVLQNDNGVVMGVFSTLAKASQYMEQRPYSSYTLVNRIIDESV